MKEFGRALRKKRQSKKMFIKDIAGPMNWSVVYFSDIERGNRKPPARKDIKQICEILKIDPHELLDLADKDRGYVELDIRKLTKNRAQAALSLARSIEHLADDDVDEINRILKKKRRTEKNE